MKALSSVSIRQYERAEAAIADYARTVELGLMAILRQRRLEGAPLPVADAGTGREALIVIGSDRGLCGGYNDRIIRFARSRMEDEPMLLSVIGARVAARLEADGRRVDGFHSLPGSVEGISRLARAVIVEIDRWTRLEGVGRVQLVHNRREGQNAAKPQAHRLLPLSDSYLRTLSAADWPGRSAPLFRMDPDRLMSWLIQQRLFVDDLPGARRGAGQRTRVAACRDAGGGTQHRGATRRSPPVVPPPAAGDDHPRTSGRGVGLRGRPFG